MVWVVLLFHVHIEEISWFCVSCPRNIKKINIFWWFGVGGPTFSCSYWRNKLIKCGWPKKYWENTYILMIWCGWSYFFMSILNKQVDSVWLTKQMLKKHMYFDDLVWVALLFHAHIEEISWFSVGGSRNIEKIHIFWWFGVGGPTFSCSYWKNKLI